MNKRIITLVLVFSLLCTLSIGASAASASRTGNTVGGTVGSYNTSAHLYTYTDHVVADTGCETYLNVTCSTAVRLYYKGSDQPVRNYGGTSASVYRSTDVLNNIRGESDHVVNAGSAWGVWNYSLSANIW